MDELGSTENGNDMTEEEGATLSALTAPLAEFGALRQEIIQRLGAQDRLVQLNLTALATIVGLVIGQKFIPALLLVVPFLSAALGFAWIHQGRQLTLIG